VPIQTCPSCGVRVIPSIDGVCPSCRRSFRENLQERTGVQGPVVPPRRASMGGVNRGRAIVHVTIVLHCASVGLCLLFGVADSCGEISDVPAVVTGVWVLLATVPVLLCPLMMLGAVMSGRLTVGQRVGGILTEAVLFCLHLAVLLPLC
jgi:hypothetical protein